MLSGPAVDGLIGRADELELLCRLVGLTQPSDAPMVVVSGDAGIGKTRLLEALRERAVAAGWRVAVGHCVDLGGSPLPYLPFSEAIGQLQRARPDRLEKLVADYPPITRLVPQRRRSTQPSAEPLDRGSLFESVQAALADLADDGPLLMLIEDLHWADQSTYDLLSFLFARAFDGPVSIVVSYRRDDLHRRHPLRTIAAGWARVPGVSRVDVEPLDDAAMSALVRELSATPLSHEQLLTVLHRAEGNPFFAEELLAAATTGSASLPKDLAGLLMVRVDQLDGAGRQLVRAVAAAGRTAREQVLAQVTGLDRDTFDQAVRAALDLNVLVVQGDGYAFRHAMLAEAVYADLLPGERTRLHAAYVRALNATHFAGAAAELARHAIAAGDQPAALRASVLAGDDAAAVGGPDEALRHYELALDVWETVAVNGLGTDTSEYPFSEVDLVEKAAAAAIAAGRTERAIALLQQRLAQARSVSDGERARLLIALSNAVLLTDSLVDAVAATSEALRLVPSEPSTALRCRVVAAHALALGDRQRDEEAIRWAGEALQLSGVLGLEDVGAQLRTMLARLRERGGDSDTSRRMLEQVVEQAHAACDPAELRALHHLAGLYFEQGDLENAYVWYRRGAQRARELSRPYAPYGIDARVLAALVAYQRGDWQEAAELTDTSGESAPPLASASLASVRMSVAAGRGDAAAVNLLELIRPWWETDGMIAILSAGAAIDLYGDQGRIDDAISIHDEMVVTIAALWQLNDFQARIRLSALLLGQLGSAAVHSGADRGRQFVQRGAELIDAAERAETMGRRRNHKGPESQAWLTRSRSEWLRLRWLAGVDPPDRMELVSAWRQSIDGFRAYGHSFELARSVTRWAAACSHETTAEVREAVASAAATARRLGAGPLLAELGGSRGISSRGVDVLTPREMEVLLMVAEGRSNRDIGERLFISTKTASVHVSNILAKLAVGGRTEAVTVARRRGLID